MSEITPREKHFIALLDRAGRVSGKTRVIINLIIIRAPGQVYYFDMLSNIIFPLLSAGTLA